MRRELVGELERSPTTVGPKAQVGKRNLSATVSQVRASATYQVFPVPGGASTITGCEWCAPHTLGVRS